MDLQYIKTMLNDPPEITTDYFMKSYRTSESYFKRIVFIGLRLKGVQYIQELRLGHDAREPITTGEAEILYRVINWLH